MNTNTIPTIALSLILITNWTGVTFKDKELGYIATNHVAEVVYQGETNHFTLKTEASEIATWRTNPPHGVILIGTNFYWNATPGTNIWITPVANRLNLNAETLDKMSFKELTNLYWSLPQLNPSLSNKSPGSSSHLTR